jgi:hypothetical protein
LSSFTLFALLVLDILTLPHFFRVLPLAPTSLFAGFAKRLFFWPALGGKFAQQPAAFSAHRRSYARENMVKDDLPPYLSVIRPKELLVMQNDAVPCRLWP